MNASINPPAQDSTTHRLLITALNGVVRNAEDGELPLFACTLGLPQTDWLAAAQYLHGKHTLPAMADRHYQFILQSKPPVHAELVALLLDGCSHTADPQQALWLAHAIAAAAAGSRHLWQDLGVGGRDEVSALLSHYFEPLYRRNTANLKWKRFLFGELGQEGSQGPDCSRCSKYATCFPAS